MPAIRYDTDLDAWSAIPSRQSFSTKDWIALDIDHLAEADRELAEERA